MATDPVGRQSVATGVPATNQPGWADTTCASVPSLSSTGAPTVKRNVCLPAQ